jgi:predicted acylesterase/phospholipase RssA
MRYSALLVLVLLCIGCHTSSYRNTSLNSLNVSMTLYERNATRAALFASIGEIHSSDAGSINARFDARKPIDADGLFVGLAISGGGSRSAVYAAAAMFELERLGVLQRVDYISAVSGGTLPAAYYCVAPDDEWMFGRTMRKLTNNFASDAFASLLLPWHYLGTMFSDLDRTDILARQFDHVLFSRGGKSLTYADLRADRPRLLLNATDLHTGSRFIFSNETFDKLNSDLSTYPLAWACAASSGVPVLLHPVTLRDFSTPFNHYIHLIDGGVNDNLGVTALVEAYTAQMAAAKEAKSLLPYPKGAIFIVLDARTNYNAEVGHRSDIGLLLGLESGAQLSTSTLINRVSDSRIAAVVIGGALESTSAGEIRKRLRELVETGNVQLTDEFGLPASVLELGLSGVRDLSLDRLPSAGFYSKLNNISTYFDIDPREALDLTKAAQLLVRDKHRETLERIVGRLDDAR